MYLFKEKEGGGAGKDPTGESFFGFFFFKCSLILRMLFLSLIFGLKLLLLAPSFI